MTEHLARSISRSPYPFETLRRCYVTRYGGMSTDLQGDQLGIKQEALAGNTELFDADRVVVGILGKGRTRPYFMDRLYEVIALDRMTPDALFKSSLGEAVFSHELDFTHRPFDTLKEGDLIVISGVLVYAKAGDGDWRIDLLAKALRDLHVTES